MVYLAKKDGCVVNHTNLKALFEMDGIEKADLQVSDDDFEAAGCIAHIDASGSIVLGEPETIRIAKEEMDALMVEQVELQAELDSRDYKVIKAAEIGKSLAETDPSLYKRREACRERIGKIRVRIAELEAVEA